MSTQHPLRWVEWHDCVLCWWVLRKAASYRLEAWNYSWFKHKDSHGRNRKRNPIIHGQVGPPIHARFTKIRWYKQSKLESILTTGDWKNSDTTFTLGQVKFSSWKCAPYCTCIFCIANLKFQMAVNQTSKSGFISSQIEPHCLYHRGLFLISDIRFIIICYFPPLQGIPGALPSKTPVSLLQELCMRRGISPKYDLLQIEGAVHEPTFVYRVTVGEFAGGFHSFLLFLILEGDRPRA